MGTITLELPESVTRQFAAGSAQQGETSDRLASILARLAEAVRRKCSARPSGDKPLRALITTRSVGTGQSSDKTRSYLAVCTSANNSVFIAESEGSVDWKVRILPGFTPEIDLNADFDVQIAELPPIKTIEQVMGRYRHLVGSSEEFMRDKQAEIDHEDRNRR
jgi:hypothetical protein